MKTKKKLLAYKIAVIGIGLLALGGVALAAGGGFWDSVADRLASILGDKISVPDISEMLGATPGTTFSSECLDFNGVNKCSEGGKYDKAGTAVLVAIKFTATSSIDKIIFTSDTGTSTATMLLVATSTSATATSSASATGLIVHGEATLPANTAIKYEFTPGVNMPNGTLIYPNQYLLFTTDGVGSYSGWELNGKWGVQWTEL